MSHGRYGNLYDRFGRWSSGLLACHLRSASIRYGELASACPLICPCSECKRGRHGRAHTPSHSRSPSEAHSDSQHQISEGPDFLDIKRGDFNDDAGDRKHLLNFVNKLEVCIELMLDGRCQPTFRFPTLVKPRLPVP